MPSKMLERRLAAILNADVVGYTRLMAEDEVATLEALNACWNLMSGLIRKHRGRVVDKVGDNLLAEFPSAVDAVQCALEIQRQLAEINSTVPPDRRMLLRIGLNLGDLIVEGERIVGNGVNIAARIQAKANPGGVAISSSILDQIEGKLPIEVRSKGAHALKNVTRPVLIFDVETTQSIERAEVPFEEDTRATRQHVPGFGGQHAIAVLPFRNLSRDKDQEYFADGLAEDLITSLAALRIYPIIARNSSFTYKDKTIDVRRVGQELGAQYIVTGSVRRADSRVRVNAELVNAEDAHQIWSGRYDREISDIFALQDEITLEIAGSVGPALSRSERGYAMRRTPQNLDAWECLHRSQWHLFQYSRENTAKALHWASRAVELQPDLAQGYSLIAFSHMYEITYQWSQDVLQSRTLAAQAAEKAVALDKDDPMALTALGYSNSLVGKWDRAVTVLQRAVEINPSSAIAFWALGSSLAQGGKPDDGIAMIEKAIRLSPQDPLMHEFMFNIGSAHFISERDEKAAEFASRSLNLMPAQPGALRLLAAASAYLGKLDEAAVALEKLVRVAPGMSEQYLQSFLPEPVVERYIEGLRLAGWKG